MATAADILDWSIYKIISPTNRVYIGVTRDFEKRMKFYQKLDCKHQRALYHSFNKYGFNAHSVEVVDNFKSNFDYAYGKEIFWIRTYMSNYAKYPEQNGLNLANGGVGSIGNIMSEETKVKLRAANLGKKYSDETKAKLSAMKMGKKINRIVTDEQKIASSIRNRQYKHTDEAKKKIGEAGKGNKYNAGRKQTPEWIEMIRKVHTGKKYLLGRKFTEAHKEAISKGNKGKIVSEETRLKLKGNKWNPKSTPILQYNIYGEFIKEYASIKEAGRESGMWAHSIREILTGVTKKPKRFIFKYK